MVRRNLSCEQKLLFTATGSVRIPALWNGCFGLRPFTGAISMEGLVSVYPGFDTPGLLGRDLAGFEKFVWNWYREAMENRTVSSAKVMVPVSLFADITGDQLHLINDFVCDLEKSLDTTAEYRSIANE
jgi:Asp-tRNA(Asn)/Glu-tRNA(Gln) amidotransferase A subunit family amidase